MFAPHPFSGIDPETLRTALDEFARRRVTEFPEILERLDALMQRVNPLSILSIIGGWGALSGVGDGGTAGKTILAGISQHHIELFQALALRLDATAWGKDPATPTDIQAAIDDICEVTEAFRDRRYLRVDEEKSKQARTVLALQERLRGHTQVVRNWGYQSEVRRISRELFSTLDELMRDRHGFRASDFLKVAEGLEAIFGERLNARFVTLKHIFRQKSIRQLVRVYHRDYPGVNGDPDEFLAIIPPGTSFEAVRSMLLSHADLSLAELLTVSAEAVAAKADTDVATVRLVLDRLSHLPGELEGKDPEFLFLANPVWLRPGIRFTGTYFFATPSTIFSFIISIMRELCDTPALRQALEKRRAAYLEDRTEAAARAALPGGKFQPNLKWAWEGTGYETDLLVVFDRTLLIIEAKSAGLTDQALRGAPARVRRHVEDLIVAPAEQSARLAKIISLAANGDAEASAAVAHLPFAPADIDQIARVSVTLDDFSVIASAEGELRHAGWVPQDLELAPTLNLADLIVIFEILESPLHILDYLIERGKLQKVLSVLGDELDHLGLYLKTGFNFAALESEVSSLAISGMSEPIDHYYTSRDAGVAVPKPRPALSPYFRELLATIAQRATTGWTTLGFALLHLGNPDEEKRIERAMETLRQSVIREYRNPDHINTLVVRPPRPRDTLGLFYIHTSKTGRDHKETASQLAAEAMESEGFHRCATIVRFVEHWHAPYRSIGIMVAPE
jgi:hypothetical protein